VSASKKAAAGTASWLAAMTDPATEQQIEIQMTRRDWA
jgi:hypothetical protein